MPRIRATLPDDVQSILQGLRVAAVGMGLVALGLCGIVFVQVPLSFIRLSGAKNDQVFFHEYVAHVVGWATFAWTRLTQPLLGIPTLVVLAGALAALWGKWVLLDGIDDSPTRRLVLASLGLDVLALGLAFAGHWPRSALTSAFPYWALGAGLSSRLAWGASASLFPVFVIRAAQVIGHDELKDDATRLRRWIAALLAAFAVAAVVALLGLGVPAAFFTAQVRRVLLDVGGGILVVVVLWGGGVVVRTTTVTLHLRNALRLWAEARVTPVPEQWV